MFVIVYSPCLCSFELESHSGRGLLDITLCDEVCQCLATGRWFSAGTSVSSTNKTDRHKIANLLLKVGLSPITLSTHFECKYMYSFVVMQTMGGGSGGSGANSGGGSSGEKSGGGGPFNPMSGGSGSGAGMKSPFSPSSGGSGSGSGMTSPFGSGSGGGMKSPFAGGGPGKGMGSGPGMGGAVGPRGPQGKL